MFRLTLVLVLLLGAGAAGLWGLDVYQRQLRVPVGEGTPALFQIRPGASLASVAGSLEQQGIVRQAMPLVWYARVKGLGGALKAGEYPVAPTDTPISLLNRFVRGQVVQHAFTIIEGWNFAELRAALARSEHIKHTLADASDEDVMRAIGLPELHPEGQFLPDTYRFPRNMSDVDFLRRAHDALEKLLTREWAGRSADLPYSNPHEALVMASIIEKETGAAAERAQIGGVFVRRLHKGMRLQTDPTVIYGVGQRFDGNLTRKHLRTDTPYNTYTRAGLPPTPIAMAGRAAIRAALHPATGNSLYFVARGDGTHKFSATLKQHQAAVRRFQLGQ